LIRRRVGKRGRRTGRSYGINGSLTTINNSNKDADKKSGYGKTQNLFSCGTVVVFLFFLSFSTVVVVVVAVIVDT
jgi:hypothetical protein